MYVCKCIESKPTFKGALRKISEVEYLERKISQNKGQLYQHNKKWRQVANHV